MNSDWFDYFEKRKHVYNLYCQSLRLRPLIDTIRKLIPIGNSVLEVGFGSGLTLVLLSNLGYRTVGVDVDEKIVEYAKLALNNYDEEITLLKMDMFNLGFKDKAFAMSFSQGVLEHFDDERIVEALCEQRRVSKIVICDVPGPRSKYGPDSFGDERFMSIKKWKELIVKARLRVLFIYGRGMGRADNWVPPALTRWLGRFICYEIGFVCGR